MANHRNGEVEAKWLREVYEDRWLTNEKWAGYVRYLYRVDRKLWSPSRLAAEFGVKVSTIDHILWGRRRKDEN